MNRHTAAACAILAGALMLVRPVPAAADPMSCGSEFKTCIASCARVTNRSLVPACINSCHANQSSCMRTGCWTGPTNRYCDLLRR